MLQLYYTTAPDQWQPIRGQPLKSRIWGGGGYVTGWVNQSCCCSLRTEEETQVTAAQQACALSGRGGVSTMLLPLLLTFSLCFLLHLWANLNLAVLLVTGRTHHRHGPQSPPRPLELHPQRHQGGTLHRPHLAQVRDATTSPHTPGGQSIGSTGRVDMSTEMQGHTRGQDGLMESS